MNQVLLEKRDDVAYITLNAPPLNILSASMMTDICAVLEEVAGDSALKAVAFTAEGKAFSAGADVGEHHPDKAPEMIGTFSKMFRALGALEIPVLMAVDGAALGAGFELAMMADILIATEKASFGQPEIRLGFFAPLGVAYLPKLVGMPRAMEITCAGRSYSAAEMLQMGLVSQVVPREGLTDALESMLKDIRRASPLVLRLNVRTLKQVRGLGFEDARVQAEKVFLDDLMATEEVLEGISSFYEKRKPAWKNR